MPRHKKISHGAKKYAQQRKAKKHKQKVKKYLETGVELEMEAKGYELKKGKWVKPELVKQTKRAAQRVRKKEIGIITERAISMRHLAWLEDPGRPFGDNRGKYQHGLLSTAIVSYEYFPDRQMLVLTWWRNWKKKIKGPEYAYFNVPGGVYEALVRASSKGRYIYYNIRTSYPYKRLTK